MSKDSKLAYKNYAIVASFFSYFEMKELGEEICEVLSEDKRDLKVAEARESSVTLKRGRNQTFTEDSIRNATEKAMRRLVENDTRILQHISDVYEFEFDAKCINAKFISDSFDFKFSGRNIIIEVER